MVVFHVPTFILLLNLTGGYDLQKNSHTAHTAIVFQYSPLSESNFLIIWGDISF